MQKPHKVDLEASFFLSAEEVALVREILAKFVPQYAVWAFGSRAHGRHVWRFSDLDLAVEGRLPWNLRVDLKTAFEESLLPIMVDVVELGAADADFVERITPDLVQVQVSKGCSGGKAGICYVE